MTRTVIAVVVALVFGGVTGALLVRTTPRAPAREPVAAKPEASGSSATESAAPQAPLSAHPARPARPGRASSEAESEEPEEPEEPEPSE